MAREIANQRINISRLKKEGSVVGLFTLWMKLRFTKNSTDSSYTFHAEDAKEFNAKGAKLLCDFFAY
jgi:hypothetical protein